MFKEKVRVQILEGKLTDKGKCLCGSYRGYEIMVNQMNGFYQICINAHSDDDVNNQKLAAFLAEHKTKVKGVLDAKISPTALLMNVKMPAFGSKCPAAINEAVMPVIQYLTMGRYSSGCEYCKSENVPRSMECIIWYVKIVQGRSVRICSRTSRKSRRRRAAWQKGSWVRYLVL